MKSDGQIYLCCENCLEFVNSSEEAAHRCPPRRKKRTPPPLSEGDKANFETLEKACKRGNLALVSSIRKSDGANVALVCAMARHDDKVLVSPLAVMVEGNPYELFEAPAKR